MVVKADYHFHPNLPKNKSRAKLKAARWFSRIEEVGLDALIVTEHSYKDAQRAYELMQECKPIGSNVQLFPGVEALTSENIDLIIFSLTSDFYEQKEITAPLHLPLKKLVEWLKDKNLYYFIPHLFTPGETSPLKCMSMDEVKKMTAHMPGIEICNTSHYGVKKIAERRRIHKVFKKTMRKIDCVLDLPKEFYLDEQSLPTVQFMAGGSDAHTFESLGPHMEIPLDIPFTRENIFKALITNTDGTFTIAHRENHTVRHLLLDALITLKEWRHKKYLILWRNLVRYPKRLAQTLKTTRFSSSWAYAKEYLRDGWNSEKR